MTFTYKDLFEYFNPISGSRMFHNRLHDCVCNSNNINSDVIFRQKCLQFEYFYTKLLPENTIGHAINMKSLSFWMNFESSLYYLSKLFPENIRDMKNPSSIFCRYVRNYLIHGQPLQWFASTPTLPININSTYINYCICKDAFDSSVILKCHKATKEFLWDFITCKEIAQVGWFLPMKSIIFDSYVFTLTENLLVDKEHVLIEAQKQDPLNKSMWRSSYNRYGLILFS